MSPVLIGALVSIGLIVFAAFVGFVVWAIQSRLNATKALKLKVREADELEKKELRESKAEELAKGHLELIERVSRLEVTTGTDAQTLALLKQEMLPMAEAMKRKLVDILTHPSDEFKIPDALLVSVKAVGGEVTPELEVLLVERAQSTNPHVTEYEKLAAEALRVTAKMAALEAREAPHLEITGVQLVTSTSKSPEKKKHEEGGL